MEEQQSNNHHFMKALIKKGWQSRMPDLQIRWFSYPEFRKFYVKLISQNKAENIIEQEIKKHVAALINRTNNGPDNIFSNKYVLDSREENIDGKYKTVSQIENRFLDYYDGQGTITVENIYDYFSMQMARSPGWLCRSYVNYIAIFGDIKNQDDYYNFKNFYNSYIPPVFCFYHLIFTSKNYKAAIKISSQPNGAPNFFFLSDAHTFCLENVKHRLPTYKNHNLKGIYVTSYSANEFLFLYDEDIHTDNFITTLSIELGTIWTALQLGVCALGIVVENNKKCIDYIADIMIMHHQQGSLLSHLNKEPEMEVLTKLQKQYEKKNPPQKSKNKFLKFVNKKRKYFIGGAAIVLFFFVIT